MKKIILMAFVAMTWVACQNESANNDSANNATTEAPTPNNNDPQGTAITPRTPVQSGLTADLTRDFWVYEFYIDPQNRKNNRNYRGKWFNLKEDGTFESGQWQETTGSGSWLLLKDEENRDLLRLDNVNDAEDAEFIVQINADGDAASWVGTKTYGQAGVMLKAINLMTEPTKQQFGVE
ncbi:MAG: hypothetical protein MRY78_02450 [Saprospiraceae bacterium]|nr:hypothetical protein [Saprospiraceae bacterium]